MYILFESQSTQSWISKYRQMGEVLPLNPHTPTLLKRDEMFGEGAQKLVIFGVAQSLPNLNTYEP